MLHGFSPDVLQKSLNNAFHPHTEFVGGSGKAGFLTGFHETGEAILSWIF